MTSSLYPFALSTAKGLTPTKCPFALSAAKGLIQTSRTPHGRRLKRGDRTMPSRIGPFAASEARM